MTDDVPRPRASETSWTWCSEPAKAPAIGRFFAAHAGASYISHSELQSGRASAVGRWSGNIDARIEAEARLAIADPEADDRPAGMRCALAETPEGIAGLAFVRFVLDAGTPYAVLEDLLIDPRHRGEGLGGGFLAWLGDRCRAQGCARLFLESGLGNHSAHHFFERQGFVQTSIVMMRDLSIS